MGGGDGGASDAAPASSSAASSIELKVPGRGICDLKTVRSRLRLCHINKNLHTCVNRQRLLHLCSGRTMPSMVTQRLMQVRGLGGCKP